MYATLNDLKSRQQINHTTWDDALQTSLDASASMVDAYCSRSFGAHGNDKTPRLFRADSPSWVRIDDAARPNDNSSAIAVLESVSGGRSGTATAITSWVERSQTPTGSIDRLGADLDEFDVSQGEWLRVTPTVGWGWLATPPPIIEATLIQAARLYKRRESASGFFQTEFAIARADDYMDRDVKQLLDPYRRGEFWTG